MEKILAAIDFSDVTTEVVENSVIMAKKFGAKIFLIHTEPPELDYVAYGLEQAYMHVDTSKYKEENRNILHDIADRIKNDGIEVETILMKGPTAQIISEEAKEIGADLIVIGTHEHGAFYHLFFGSTRESIIQDSKVPILVVPPKEEAE